MQIVESAYFDTKILSYINYDLFGKLFNGTEDNAANNSSIITNNFYYTYTIIEVKSFATQINHYFPHLLDLQ